MARRAIPWIVGGIAAAVAAIVWIAWPRPEPLSDRQQVLRLIADVERAVEQKRVSDLMRYVSKDYHDSHGYDRRMVQRLAIAGARDPQPIDLSVEVTDITVKGDTATFTAEVDYSLVGFAAPGRSTHLTVRGELRRERGGWKVISADGWQGAESAY